MRFRNRRAWYALLIAIPAFLVGLAANSVVGMTDSAVAQRGNAPVKPPAQATALVNDPEVARMTKIILPELTQDERARALSIAGADARLQRLLSGRRYSVDSVHVWQASKSQRKLGAGIVFSLAEPAAFDLDWPVVEFDETEATDPPYKLGTRNFAADNIRRLEILVDLQHNRLLQIRPGPGSRTTRPPTAPTRTDRGPGI